MAIVEEVPDGWAQANEPMRPVTAPRSELDKGADSIGQYLNQIGKTALLSAEEEVAIAKRIDAGAFAGIILSLQDPETQDQTLVNMSKTIENAGVGTGKDKENARKRTDDERRAEIGRLFYYATEDQPEIERPDGTVAAPSKRELRRIVQDGEKAKEHLIKANLRLVVSVAKKYQHAMPLLDAIQEGNEGLVHAVKKFDYTKGFKFSTYSTWWIRQSITRAIANTGRTIRIPVHMVEQINKTTRIQRELRDKLDTEPTHEQIAEELGISADKVKELLEYDAPIRSLNHQRMGKDGDAGELGDYVHDQVLDAPDEDILTGDMVSRTREAINWLPEREGKVLRMRFGIDGEEAVTLDVIGAELGVSRETVRKIEAKARKYLVNNFPELKSFLIDTAE